MLMTDRALVGPHQPSLEKPDDAVDPRQYLRGRLLVALEDRHLLEVAFRAQAVVATPAICMDHAARLDGVEHKCVEASGICRSRIRPMPFPSSCAAMTIRAFFSTNRPRSPSSNPPR